MVPMLSSSRECERAQYKRAPSNFNSWSRPLVEAVRAFSRMKAKENSRASDSMPMLAVQKSKAEKNLIGGVGWIPGGGADWRSWHGWNTGRRGNQRPGKKCRYFVTPSLSVDVGALESRSGSSPMLTTAT